MQEKCTYCRLHIIENPLTVETAYGEAKFHNKECYEEWLESEEMYIQVI